jgi:hypothetical protein
MPQAGSADDARRRSLADLSILDAGAEGDPRPPTAADQIRQLRVAALLPGNGGLFGSGWAQYMADRLGAAANPTQGYPLDTLQSGTTWRYGSPRPVNVQALSYRQRQTPSAPPPRPAAQPAAPTKARSPFDAAQGALRDFQNGPKIPRPNVAESFIPVVGPAWQAAGDLQDRNYAGAAANAALAGSDLFVAGAVAKDVARGGMYALKAAESDAANPYAWKAVRKWMGDKGFLDSGQHGHHWLIPQNKWGKNVPDWIKNHPLNIKPMPDAVTHWRIDHRVGGLPRFNPAQRYWFGTPDWLKVATGAAAGHAVDAAKAQSDRR